MKILMISDLHIGDNSDEYLNTIFHRVDKIFNIINTEVRDRELLVIAMCGDVVDGGKKCFYPTAEKIFDYIKEKTGSRRVEFVLIPGNHDLCDNSFHSFDMFCKKYRYSNIEFEKQSCYSQKVENINFILANSTYHKDYSYGKVDTDRVKACADPYSCNILLTHHSPISEDENDMSAIRNMPRLLDAIREMNITYHLHGHTHGTYWHRMNDCIALGVGAMFQAAEEMGSQFHLIEIKEKRISEIKNYYYRIDSDKYFRDDIALEEPDSIKQSSFGSETDVQPDFMSAETVCKNGGIYEEIKVDEYQLPDGYIPRLVGPFDMVQWGGVNLLYNKELLKPLIDILYDKTRIVLLGEAGAGKSYELKKLAYELSRECKAVPVFIELDDYIDETIDELVGEKKSIGTDVVFIFDAYDEIEDQNLYTFARRLNTFVKKNKNQKIIVSTRNNFYRNSPDKATAGTFRDFYECALCPLMEDDIHFYLDRKGIDYNLFMEEVQDKKLDEQLSNPFFLVQIAGLFEENRCLPTLNQLMNKLIDNSIKEDDKHYLRTSNIYDRKQEMINSAQVLAFAMQCLKKTTLNPDEYQEILSQEERCLMKYCGLWKKNEKEKWQFQHNNFREYLAACFLKKKTLEQIIELVTFEDNIRKIKESWVNVLSFLVGIYPDRCLLDWIIEVSPSIVVKFEISRIENKDRTRAFLSIFKEYKKANMWISWNQNDVKDLALFGQSSESIDYLIREVREESLFRIQSNAIHLLGEMTDFYGRKDAVRAVLKNCCIDVNTRSYEKKASIMALMNPVLHDDADIMYLMELFKDEKDSQIRYALYCYIKEYHLQDVQLEYILKGVKIPVCNGDNFSARIRLKELLKSLTSCESFHQVFLFVLNEMKNHEIMDFLDDIFTELCINAEKFYGQEDNILLEDIQQIFMRASSCCENSIMLTARKYLEYTNQIFSTYEKILKEKNGDTNIIFLLEDIMDEECLNDFADRYKNDTLCLDDLFVSYVRRCKKGSYRYEEFRELIYQKNGIVIKQRVDLNYETLRKDGIRRYFNALFDKNIYQNLIEELACICGGDIAVYEDLNNFSYHKMDIRFDLQKVVWDIRNNKFIDRKIIHFLSYVNWENFSIANIYEELSSENDIIVTQQQKAYIKEYCLKTVRNIDFQKEIVYKKDGSFIHSPRVMWCVWFANKFSIEYDKEILYEMIRVSSYMFDDTDSGQNIFARYLTERLNEKQIQYAVFSDLKRGDVQGNLAETYINYCMENGFGEALELADSIVCDKEYAEGIRRTALKYLLSINKEEYVVDKYLSNEFIVDSTLLQLMESEMMYTKNPTLIAKLIIDNEASKSKILHLKSLIKMESEYGLEKYYDIAKKMNSIVDFSNSNNIASITEAIGEVVDVKHLDRIIKLARLATTEGFQDHGVYGLYSSTIKSIKSMAQNNPELVVQRLNEALNEKNCNSEFTCFCNYILNDIQEEYYSQNDKALTIEKIRGYLQQ